MYITGIKLAGKYHVQVYVHKTNLKPLPSLPNLNNFLITQVKSSKRIIYEYKSLKLLKAVLSFYIDSRQCVRVGNDVSEWFPASVGLRQGCVMAPWLFNVYMKQFETILFPQDMILDICKLHWNIIHKSTEVT